MRRPRLSAPDNSSYHVFFAGRRIARADWGSSSFTVYYYFVDHLGSTRSMTNASGTVCFKADYLPYGAENTPSGFSDSCNTTYKFTGYERDGETGLDYAFARYYNQRLGRFMSGDPLPGDASDPQSLNRYSYVRNNPINATDPTGMWGQPPARHPLDCDWDLCANSPWSFDPEDLCFNFGIMCFGNTDSGNSDPDPQVGGGGGGGGSGSTLITRAIEKVRSAVSNDPNCLGFLNSNGGDVLQWIGDLQQHPEYIASQALGQTANPNGSIQITNAQTPGVEPGQAITLNTDGAFYSPKITTDRGRIRGGSPKAQAFILLHEIGHLTKALVDDATRQALVDRNDKNLEDKCKNAIKTF